MPSSISAATVAAISSSIDCSYRSGDQFLDTLLEIFGDTFLNHIGDTFTDTCFDITLNCLNKLYLDFPFDNLINQFLDSLFDNAFNDFLDNFLDGLCQLLLKFFFQFDLKNSFGMACPRLGDKGFEILPGANLAGRKKQGSRATTSGTGKPPGVPHCIRILSKIVSGQKIHRRRLYKNSCFINVPIRE